MRSLVGHLRAAVIVIAAAMVFPVVPSHADEAARYCALDEPFAPDGVILRMAERYIRVCRPWTGDAGGRQAILRLNPAAIPDLENRYAASNLRVDERFTADRRREAWTRNHKYTGTRRFGLLVYEAYERRENDTDDLPTMALYIYNAPDRPGWNVWPSHWVVCVGEAHVPGGGTESCKVVVHHTDHLSASLLFITSNRRSPMPRDHFPFFAQEIVKVLDVADVTDRLEAFEGVLDIVD